MSALGLGTASLPDDEDESISMVRYAIDAGVNLLDIKYNPGIRRREKLAWAVGKPLQDHYRQKVKIAVTLPSRNIKSPDHLNEYLQQQLEYLGLESVDFALLGWLDRQIWPKLREMGVLGWCDAVQADRKVGAFGFCFHDDYQTLRNIIDSYDKWTLCKIIFNYMDVDHHPGIGGIRFTAEKELAVVAAEPLKGGRLLRNLPDSVSETWGDRIDDRSLVEWALRWVWHYPEVSTVISDAGSMEELRENINLAGNVSEDKLSVQEQIVVNKVRDAYRALKPVGCTACRACMPCPQDVDFPRIFELCNDAVIYDDTEIPRAIYIEEGLDIGACNECGICEERCGKNVAVRKWLKESRKTLQG